MFIYIKHGDNEQFLVNTSCPVIVLMQYIKNKLGLLASELVDLCDDQGVLKIFLPQNLQEFSHKLLKARESFVVCIINCKPDGAYTSVTSLLSGVDSALLETIQTQIDILEKTRLQQLHLMETRMATSEEINARALPSKSTKKLKKVTSVNAPDKEVQRQTRDRKSRA